MSERKMVQMTRLLGERPADSPAIPPELLFSFPLWLALGLNPFANLSEVKIGLRDGDPPSMVVKTFLNCEEYRFTEDHEESA